VGYGYYFDESAGQDDWVDGGGFECCVGARFGCDVRGGFEELKENQEDVGGRVL